MNKAEQMQSVIDLAEKQIGDIDSRLRPEVIAERKAEIVAWRRGELDELLQDGLEGFEAERVKAAQADYKRRRARGPQTEDWPEVGARSAWIQADVTGLALSAIPVHYQELAGLGDRLGAWLVQKHGLARLDSILTDAGSDRQTLTAALAARDSLAKAAWGKELVKHRAALTTIRKSENTMRKLAGDDQQMIDDARARFGIRDYSNVPEPSVTIRRRPGQKPDTSGR